MLFSSSINLSYSGYHLITWQFYILVIIILIFTQVAFFVVITKKIVTISAIWATTSGGASAPPLMGLKRADIFYMGLTQLGALTIFTILINS